jgi:CheY-like chemotaxis protein
MRITGENRAQSGMLALRKLVASYTTPYIIPPASGEHTTVTEPRILIIDDEPAHLKLYSWILQREGFLTTTALVEHNGIELPPTQEEFDIALLDYRLQGITAVDVAKKIRNQWPGMPIVVLSDMMWIPEDMVPVANGFIRKGEPQLLVEKITEMTRRDTGPTA